MESIETWTTIVDAIGKMPGFANRFNPPASEADIESLERKIGRSLPESFKSYLRTANGEDHRAFSRSTFGFNCFLSCKEIEEFWSLQISLFADEPEISGMHEAKLKPLLWSPGWIPFSAFNATVALVLDLEPGVGGSYGQVFGYHAGFDQESDEVVLASSFSEFSERLLSDLQSHNYSVQDGTVEFDDEWI